MSKLGAHMQNTIVAFITTNLSRSHLPTQVLIEVNAPAGQQSGLIADSVVSCENCRKPIWSPKGSVNNGAASGRRSFYGDGASR